MEVKCNKKQIGSTIIEIHADIRRPRCNQIQCLPIVLLISKILLKNIAEHVICDLKRHKSNVFIMTIRNLSYNS